ncbi:MAG: Crp/Fnr family transcriptional regulator [Candidatus Thiodiazotropha sp.]|jgi:hypothetical protein
MQPVPKQQKLKPEQRRLLSLYKSLDASGREAVLAFAEFLTERQAAADSGAPGAAPLHEPKPIERPAEESVVKAIKRLSESYFMLEREPLLDKTSSLMMSHVLQGRDAVSVIDELEVVFREYYERYLRRQDTAPE